MESHSPNMDKYWTDSPSHYDRNLNFVALANDGEEDDDFGCSKKKAARDPMSHRIIEKRRRDRMNNCLADLSRLLPAAYLKKGRGRIEKTEIIEMAIKHMRHLQVHACQQAETCEVANSIERQANNTDQQYRLGYSECMSEMMHFLVEVEGFFAGDALCSRLMNHLQMHGEKITRGAVGFQQMNARSSSASSGSSSADYLRNGTSSSGSSAESGKFIPRSGTSSSSNSSSKSLKPQSSSEANLKETVKNEETDSSCPRLLSHPSSGVDSEDTDRSSFHCTTNPSSTSPSDNNNQDSSDSGANIQQKDLKDLFLADSGFASTGASSHSSSTRLDDTNLYKKYKTDIQQRFTAEEHQTHEELDDNNDSEASKRRKIAYKTHSLHEPSKYDFKAPIGGADTTATLTKPLKFELRPRPSSRTVIQNGTKPPSERSSSSYSSHFPESEPASSIETSNSSHSNSTGSIPVFVLHPQGSFYVPTLIEAPIVTPLLSEHVPSPVLHPITIHVSFGYANKVISGRPEVLPPPAAVPATNPVVGHTRAMTVERRERLSPMEKRKSPHVMGPLVPLEPPGGDNSNNVRRWMEDRVLLEPREYSHTSEELRQPLSIDYEPESHRRTVDGVMLRGLGLHGSVHPPLPPPTSVDIKEATARSLLELSTHGIKDGYRSSRVGLGNETEPTYLFPVQDNVVPVHPLPARECEVLREVPPANSARWSYLMANAKRP